MPISKNQLPEGFLERLEKILGPALTNQITKTFVDRPTSFRVNTLKTTRAAARAALAWHGFKTHDVLWYKDAFVLINKSQKELMTTELYQSGQIYLQSLASMVPPLILDPKPNEKVLDLTAAPGSKTSQIAAMMNGVGELHANDNSKIRFAKLAHNLNLLGVSVERPNWQCVLTTERGSSLVTKFAGYFDKILLDAPCTAEARFIAGSSRTYGYWSERNIKEMAYQQRQLLLSAWGALKPGGTLVYSTCTFAPEENEEQVDRLLERFPDAKLAPASLPDLIKAPIVKEWNQKKLSPEINKCLRILPTKDIEGFFVAKISKKDS